MYKLKRYHSSIKYFFKLNPKTASTVGLYNIRVSPRSQLVSSG